MVLLDHLGSVYILEKDLAFVVESSLLAGLPSSVVPHVPTTVWTQRSCQPRAIKSTSSSVAVAAIQLPRSAGQRRLSAASGYFRRVFFFFFWARRAFRKVRIVIVRSRWWTKWVSFFGGLNNWKHGNWALSLPSRLYPHDLSCALPTVFTKEPEQKEVFHWEPNAASLHCGCPSWSKQVAFSFSRPRL